MGTLRGGYRLADGTRVPSVTTILSRFKDAGGLIHWAWELGLDGKDYRAVRDDAATAGTLAHEAVERWIKGEPVGFPENAIGDKASKAFGAFVEWADQTQLKVTETELPMVSERHRFGGTFDAILVKGKRAMGDWKTSNGLYPEYLIQVAAYAALWGENRPNEPIEGGFHVLRFDKNFGDFHHHYFGELGEAWEAFQHMRALYDIDKNLKARAK